MNSNHPPPDPARRRTPPSILRSTEMEADPSAPTPGPSNPSAQARSALPRAETPPDFEDDRSGMRASTLRRAFLDNLHYLQGKTLASATMWDRYMALAFTVRDRIMARWLLSEQTYAQADAKRVYYLTAEFLPGRMLLANLHNVDMYAPMVEALRSLDLELDDILEVEPDPGLGNGGLGRLAACFLDSLGALQLPACVCSIRYEYGSFAQEIHQGKQIEKPDPWLQVGHPWELVRPEHTLSVHFGGSTSGHLDAHGRWSVRWTPAQTVLGVPYDVPWDGYGNHNANTLRLWRARATKEFDLQEFEHGDYLDAVAEKNLCENISKVLYPNDDSAQGRELRLKQEYFFVSCSLQDALVRYHERHASWHKLATRVAFHLNDTHPALAVAELIRLLLDRHHLDWEAAWRITVDTLSYTNHTLMAEALETWPVDLFAQLLPRHLEIIREIDRRHLDRVRKRWPQDEARLARMAIVPPEPEAHVRMAWLAAVGSHAINGVSQLHTRLLCEQLLRDFHELDPERFHNKTNGISPRRWLLLANPLLARELDACLGPGWTTELERLHELLRYAHDEAFLERLASIKLANKVGLARFIGQHLGVAIDPGALFDVQAKRMHEYKRQHLAVLHLLVRCLRLRAQPDLEVVPRVFLFAGKAAPGYAMARRLVRLICAAADYVARHSATAARYQVVFLPNYSVSLAERLLPAADLSEQIATAGFEASGTGNMKMALNGALTIGTLDGANLELRDAVGADHFFAFGHTAAEFAALRARGYRPADLVEGDAELAAVLDLLRTGCGQSDADLEPLWRSLVEEDRFGVLADFRAYVAAQDAVETLWRNPGAWRRQVLMNLAGMGRFSSDRAVAEYAREIWKIERVEVQLPGGTAAPPA